MHSGPAYCPFYCEENIWQLCTDPRVGPGQRRVLTISNPSRRVAMWGQRIASDPALPIAWDYHVILLARAPTGPWLAWDLDAHDGAPTPAASWLDASFRGAGLLPQQFEPRFRLLESSDYRRHLRSDRRHMRTPDGMFKQPPPSWPEIMGAPVPGFEDDGSNLDHFLDTEDPRFLGEPLDQAGLRAWLRQSDAPTRA